ncbi:MAG: tyrosine-type recombinase/integrase [Pseudomonadota bacterium]
MRRSENKLTAKAVQSLSDIGRHSDGGGLYLVVDKDGAKRWVYIYQLHGRRREMGLGPYPAIPLGAAREARNDARVQLARGIDPIEARRREAAARAVVIPKFGEYAKAFVRSLPLGNEKYRKQWERSLTELCPRLQKLPLNEIDVKHVVEAVKPHWERIPETAERMLGRIGRVLDAAKADGHIQGPWQNPASWRGEIKHLLAKPRRDVKHHAALPYEEIGAFMAELRTRSGFAACALEFAILTAARTSEVRFLTWDEIDLQEKRWICPGPRMKMKREHRVPLSSAAMGVLERVAIPWKSSQTGFVFPRDVDGPALSDGAMERVLDRMGVKATVHGFRSTFRDWAGDCTDFPENVIEAALAHTVGDETKRAYRRRDAFEKRRRLMQDWADFCGRIAGENVLQLGPGTAQGSAKS